VLRDYYNIPNENEIYFSKVDYETNQAGTNSSIGTPHNSKLITYSVFDSFGNKLNISVCSNVTITVSIPITNTSNLNFTLYEMYKQYGVDFFNPNDPFFHDRCFSFSDSISDFTLNDRIAEIYQNVSTYCDNSGSLNDDYNSCVYDQMEEGFIDCTCGGNSTSIQGGVFTEFLTPLTKSNFMVIECIMTAFSFPQIWTNIGFYFFLALFVMCISFNYLFYYLFENNSILHITKNLHAILHSDCRMLANRRNSGTSEKSAKNNNIQQLEERVFTATGKDYGSSPPIKFKDKRQEEEFGSQNTINDFVLNPRLEETKNLEEENVLGNVILENTREEVDNIDNFSIKDCSPKKLYKQNSSLPPEIDIKEARDTIINKLKSSTNMNKFINLNKNQNIDNLFTNETPTSSMINMLPNSRESDDRLSPDRETESRIASQMSSNERGPFIFTHMKKKFSSRSNLKFSDIIPKNSASTTMNEQSCNVVKKDSAMCIYHFTPKSIDSPSKKAHTLKPIHNLHMIDETNQVRLHNTFLNSSLRDKQEKRPIDQNDGPAISKLYVSSNKTNMMMKLNDTEKKINLNQQETSNSYNKVTEERYQELKYTPMMKDYEQMTIEELCENEKRSFCRYYWILLVDDHILLAAFLKKSLIKPYHIRITLLFFNISLEFAVNAFFYSDSYISKRHVNQVSPSDIFYSLINEMPKSIWSLLITSLITFLIKLYINPPEYVEEEFNKSMKTIKVETIQKGLLEYLKIMKRRIVIFYNNLFVIFIFFWYYVICFCACYPRSQIGWLVGGFISFFFSMFVFELLIPLIISFHYFLGIKFKCKFLHKLSFFINLVKIFNT
jgi:hypothetical protein